MYRNNALRELIREVRDSKLIDTSFIGNKYCCKCTVCLHVTGKGKEGLDSVFLQGGSKYLQ
jgi:hypothetical protein